MHTDSPPSVPKARAAVFHSGRFDGITIQPAYRNQAIRELLVEYTGVLLEQNPAFAGYLKQQNFAAELDNLQEKYGVPEGRLMSGPGRWEGARRLRGDEKTGCPAV
ncbi:MAG: hypothetical protein ACLT9P_10395 [Evtepia gabavorous]